MSMRTTYDKEADAAYIYIKENIKKGEVARTIALNDDINLDFDKKNKLIGIEVLRASKNMPDVSDLKKIAA